eukprot:14008080-Ditylum_brightwellii.AAC.1
MTENLKANMVKRLQELKEKEIMPLADFMRKISTTVISNEESLQKVKSNLNVATQTISKLKTKLTMQKEIYSTQQKEKLNKAIHDTKQVATKLSKACNKAPSLNFQVPDSRFDNINKTLHYHDEEMQKLMNKISFYSQQKGHFTGTHPTVLNYNGTTELFPILKPTKH